MYAYFYQNQLVELSFYPDRAVLMTHGVVGVPSAILSAEIMPTVQRGAPSVLKHSQFITEKPSQSISGFITKLRTQKIYGKFLRNTYVLRKLL